MNKRFPFRGPRAMETVDLGLSVLWTKGSCIGVSTFEEALALQQDGFRLPRLGEVMDLLTFCWRKWDREYGCLKVKSDIGTSILLPPEEGRECEWGRIWTSTEVFLDGSPWAKALFFNAQTADIELVPTSMLCAVRLVKDRNH